MEKSKRSQLCFDIDAETKQKIKLNAALRNISVSKWMISAVRSKLRDEPIKIIKPKE